MLLRIGPIQIKLKVELLESSPLTEHPSIEPGSPAHMEASLSESREEAIRYLATHAGLR